MCVSDNGSYYRYTQSIYELFMTLEPQWTDVPYAYAFSVCVNSINIGLIFVDKDKFKKYGFTDEEIESVYYHEVGHIDIRSIHYTERYSSTSKIDMEVYCDKYAAKHTSKDITLSALKKILATFDDITDYGRYEIETRIHILEHMEV